MAATLKMVAIDRVVADPDQPRKLFTEPELQELADSITELGIQTPLTLRYRRSDRTYMVVSGERRLRAALMAGLTELPAQVLGDLNDEQAFVRAIAENVVRQDMTPMEEARAYARLADEFGWDHERIAKQYGKSVAYVTYRVDLLGLTEGAQEALNKNQLPIGLAWYACRLSPDNQTVLLRKWGRGEFANFREAEAFAQTMRDAEQQPSMFEVEEVTEEKREQQTRTRTAAMKELQALERAVAALDALAKLEAADLAAALAGAPGGVAAFRERVLAADKVLRRVKSSTNKAAALAAAAPAPAVAEDLVEDEELAESADAE